MFVKQDLSKNFQLLLEEKSTTNEDKLRRRIHHKFREIKVINGTSNDKIAKNRRWPLSAL